MKFFAGGNKGSSLESIISRFLLEITEPRILKNIPFWFWQFLNLLFSKKFKDFICNFFNHVLMCYCFAKFLAHFIKAIKTIMMPIIKMI